MAQAAKVLFQGLLTNAAATLYTIPEGKSVALTTVLVVNVDVAARTFTLYFIAPTLTAATPSLLANAVSVAQNTSPTVFPATGVLLTQGYVIQGLASANNGLSCLICGIEYDI